jgi:hypothetical protein
MPIARLMRDAADHHDVPRDLLPEVPINMRLHRVLARHCSTHLGVDLIPRPTDLSMEVADQRSEILV